MDAYHKYHWCIHVVRKVFKIMFQEIFAKQPTLSAGNFSIIGFCISVLLACIYTMFTYDKLTAFLSVIVFFGITQVCGILNAVMSIITNYFNLKCTGRILWEFFANPMRVLCEPFANRLSFRIPKNDRNTREFLKGEN